MTKRPPIVIIKKSRKPNIEVTFIPDMPKPTLCKPGYAQGAEPQPNVKPKKGAKIKYLGSWRPQGDA